MSITNSGGFPSNPSFAQNSKLLAMDKRIADLERLVKKLYDEKNAVIDLRVESVHGKYDSFRVKELKEICEERGLDHSNCNRSSKVDYIALLEANEGK